MDEPVLMANVNAPDSHRLATYEAGGGYGALRKTLKERSPDDARRDEDGKLVITHTTEGRETTVPRWLGVKLPAGAKADDAVFQYRLQQIAAAADRIGLRHGLNAANEKKPDDPKPATKKLD